MVCEKCNKETEEYSTFGEHIVCEDCVAALDLNTTEKILEEYPELGE